MANVLSRRKFLQIPIAIRADLSPNDRVTEAVLLHERWKLIQSGLERSSIKLRKSSLFIKGSLHGKVSGSNFQLSPDFVSPNHLTPLPCPPSGYSSVSSLCAPVSSVSVDTQSDSPVDTQSDSHIPSPLPSSHCVAPPTFPPSN